MRIRKPVVPTAGRTSAGESAHTTPARVPRFESAMWGMLAGGAMLTSLRGHDAYSYATLSGITAHLLFSWLIVAIVLLYESRPLRPAIVALLAIALLVGFASFIELARWHGWINTGAPAVHRQYMAPLLLAVSLALFDCHFCAIQAARHVDLEVERRVAEKTQQIEVNQAWTQETLRKQTLLSERQRILADMHDGLGASLIGLLRHVQSGDADRAHIERRVREALREMRIAIDALQPHEEDIGTVLGNLRYRLHDTIASSGVQLKWDVDELPATMTLSPSTIFSIQRILLEAIANVLKHSGARQLRLKARARNGAAIEIQVEDDGHGFDPAQCSTGFGIASMRVRAERIGAALEIRSETGAGTLLRLLVPDSPPSGGEQSKRMRFAPNCS